MLRRRSEYTDDLDSGSAVATALQRCDTTFAASVFRRRTTGQVLYLEAGKDLIDTLLSFLLLPVGTALYMLSKGVSQARQYGAMSSLFESVEKLDRLSLLHVNKSSILAQPRPAARNPAGLCKSSTSTGLLELCLDADAKRPSPPPQKQFMPQQFFQCDNCTVLSSKRGDRCYFCWPDYQKRQPNLLANSRFNKGPYDLSAEDILRQDVYVAELEPVEEFNRSTGQGFVKENMTFLVTDKLEIMPSTSTESMNVLKELNVAFLADLEVNKVTVTITQVLQLLQAALTSSSCLNDVLGAGKNSSGLGESSSREIDAAETSTPSVSE